MIIQSLTTKILTGNLLFAACCIVYLIWWSVAFRPGFTAPMALKGFLFLATAALGVAGLVQIIIGCQMATGASDGGFGGVRYIWIIAASAAVYMILLVLTNVLMQRQVTTELMLIVFWVCMEVCACDALLGGGVISRGAFVVLTLIVLVAAAISMICYLKYYDLEPMKAFYDGMVPLILFAVVMLGISGYIWLRMKGL